MIDSDAASKYSIISTLEIAAIKHRIQSAAVMGEGIINV